jgi:NADH dehydrogenase [ubiquinone] 1 alpha subcomplex assembly factor 6
MGELSNCAQEVKRGDYERFLCAMFAPEDRREALFALYAFNLEVASIRETVSEPLLGRIRLQWWRDAVDAIFSGHAPKHPVVGPLSDAISNFSLSRKHFDTLLDGREFDMEERMPENMEALLDYALATSSSVNLLALEVLGVRDEAAEKAARSLGLAWAVIGLIRSIRFHAGAGRCYLPLDLCRDAGLQWEGTFLAKAGRDEGKLSSVVAIIAEAAEGHLKMARKERQNVSAKALPVLLSAVLSDAYLSTLRRARYDPFAPALHKQGIGRVARVVFYGLRGRY